MVSNNNNLDLVIEKVLNTVSQSKEQIFEINECSRQEYESLAKELQDVRKKVGHIIEETDKTEVQARLSRNRLAEVSKQFQQFSSEEVRSAYEQANEYQVNLAVLQQKEKQLRKRRDQIELRLTHLRETMDRAETLVGQVSVVYNFLTGDLKEMGELVEDAKEKQKFGLKIIEAQEKERKRVAREIHDGPAQMIANVLLRSDLVERVYNDQGIEAALAEIRDLKGMIKSSLSEVRRIIYDLRPMALDDLGLIPTLNKYLKTFEEHSGMNITFMHFGKEIRLSPNLEVGLFRLVQEAVQNAYKHAEPTEVKVKVEVKASDISIVVKDDGKGFDKSAKTENSFGIMGMKERINVLKGRMSIDSAPNKGTTVMIKVPNHYKVEQE